MNGCQRHIVSFTTVLSMLLVFVQGCRRPLFVAGSEYHSAVLVTDWRQYDSSDPDGMTTWFYPSQGGKAYRFTTADVRKLQFYLATDTYTGVVID